MHSHRFVVFEVTDRTTAIVSLCGNGESTHEGDRELAQHLACLLLYLLEVDVRYTVSCYRCNARLVALSRLSSTAFDQIEKARAIKFSRITDRKGFNECNAKSIRCKE